jgi:putative DNA primase/helicase
VAAELGLIPEDGRSTYDYSYGARRRGDVVESYVYETAEGKPYQRVDRTEYKQFLQLRWNGADWEYGAPNTGPLPYKLPTLVAADITDAIYIAEGEKDANRLISLGLLATTAPGGAGKWPAEFSRWFDGRRRVFILEDNDAAGREHARKVAAALDGAVQEIRIVSLPDLAEKGDVSDWLDAGGTKEELARLCSEAELFAPGLVLDEADPARTARAYLGSEQTDPRGRKLLYRFRSSFWRWKDGCYRSADDEEVRAEIWGFLDGAKRRTRVGRLERFKPKRGHVTDVVDALSAATMLRTNLEPPFWLSGQVGDHPSELFVCANGIVHLPSGRLLDPDPDLFALAASDVRFDPEAPQPRLFFDFLDSIFHGDVGARTAIQEWFGYLLSPETAQQKILLIIGPRRSGKGTLGRVMSGLLGGSSVAGPTMSSLAESFGLEPLIGKSLALVPDARLGGRTDKAAITERLLSISGEDQLSVSRKFKSAWQGRLGARLVIMTNELPALSDVSNALAGRFLMVVLKQSFYGEEDQELESKLKAELPGILNWAIEGYRALKQRGRFLQPSSAQEALEALETVGSPIRAFLKERCKMGPDHRVSTEALYTAWVHGCGKQGRVPRTKEWFGRDLQAVQPGVTQSRPAQDGVRVRMYEGIALKDDQEELM